MTEKKRLFVLHEYGDPRHYLAAHHAAVNSLGYTISYKEFSPLLLFFRALRKRNMKSILQVINSTFWLCKVFLRPRSISGDKVILGCAPLDWRILMLARCLKHADVIYHSSWLVWDGSKYPHTPVIFKKFIYSRWQTFLCTKVDQFALVTGEVKHQLEKHVGISAARAQVVYHSYDSNIFTLAPTRTVGSRLQILYVGRLVAEKGLDIVFKLAGLFPHYDFSIVGEGPLVEEVNEQVTTLNNVSYLGYVKDRVTLASIYQRSDILLQPSKRNAYWEELFGMAIIEAMACGVVPLCSSHIGPRTIFANSLLQHNVFDEGDWLIMATKQLQKYELHANVLQRDRGYVAKVAADYTQTNIAKIWLKILSGK